MGHPDPRNDNNNDDRQYRRTSSYSLPAPSRESGEVRVRVWRSTDRESVSERVRRVNLVTCDGTQPPVCAVRYTRIISKRVWRVQNC